MARNPLRIDPSRTGAIRREWIADFSRRFAELRAAIIELVVDEDAFGLKERILGLQLNARWEFRSADEKVKAFREWLQSQVDAKLLTVDAVGEAWTAKYVNSAYLKGVTRSFIEVRKHLGIDKPAGFMEGSKAEFLRSAFSQPERLSKVRLLATRAFEDLKGVTTQMATDMNRVLSDAMTKGLNPRAVARELSKTLDISKSRALRIARTEIIHAHAEGQLDGMEDLGIEEVGAMVEWLTAGDDRVCPSCSALQGVVLKIKDARGLLPRHPNCRCAWIPVIGKESGQKRTKAQIEKAVRRSLKAERPNARNPRRASRWAGADLKLRKRSRR